MAATAEARRESVTLNAIRDLERRSHTIIDRLRERVFAPGSQKTLEIRFTITRAADMVGRTPAAIRDAEKDGRLPEPTKDERTGRRVGYTLTEVNHMRDVFGTRPWRTESDEAVVLAVQNFKGGVGKSTLVTHTAQYLALRGYRVAVVDCDSQATTTTIFGINPDVDVSRESTLLPFLLHGGESTLDYALRQTYWDGVKLIPANLSLYNAEYDFAARLKGNPLMLDRLRSGIEGIQHQFDVILLDPPPALGMLSLSVLRAANALLIPVPPSTVDFGSTSHFLTMLVETLEILEQQGMAREYKFLRVLATRVNESKSAHVEISNMMEAVFGNRMIHTRLKDSAEIDNASAQLMTVYELPRPQTSRDTHERCKAYLNGVNSEIELLIRRTWPSHAPALRQQGRM